MLVLNYETILLYEMGKKSCSYNVWHTVLTLKQHSDLWDNSVYSSILVPYKFEINQNAVGILWWNNLYKWNKYVACDCGIFLGKCISTLVSEAGFKNKICFSVEMCDLLNIHFIYLLIISHCSLWKAGAIYL